MTFRSSNQIEEAYDKRQFSCRQPKKRSMQQFRNDSSQIDWLQFKINNFNSGHASKAISDSSSSKSQVSSENQTQNFIRAEFKQLNIKQTQDFKLFNTKVERKDENFKKNKSPHQNQSREKKLNRRQNLNTAYFQIQIQDGNQESKKFENHNYPGMIKQNYNLELSSKRQHQNTSSHKMNPSTSNRYSQLQSLQKAIMRTLRQKQKQISLLQKELQDQNEEKLYCYQINQQLQSQLNQLRKTGLRNQQARLHTLENADWKPSSVEEMKFMIENQKLRDQLREIDNQETKLKQYLEEIQGEQIVLKDSLKTALKTRKQYVKGITGCNHPKQQSRIKQIQATANTHTSKQYKNDHRIPKQRIHSTKKEKENSSILNNNSLLHPEQKGIKNKKQPHRLQQKQLLLRLLEDFNQLKIKVDESLIAKSKSKSIKANKQSSQKKEQRRVVYAKR